MKSPYTVYVFNFNDYSSLSAAMADSQNLPETQTGHFQVYSFPTKDEQLAFMEGVHSVNTLPGDQQFDAIPLEYYLLQVYRGEDYDESYTAARADGAIYDTGVKVRIEDLKNPELLGSYMKICDTSDRCIHDGQSNLQMLLVNPFEPTEFHRIRDFV